MEVRHGSAVDSFSAAQHHTSLPYLAECQNSQSETFVHFEQKIVFMGEQGEISG